MMKQVQSIDSLKITKISCEVYNDFERFILARKDHGIEVGF